jgi:tRNA A37 threonylcarbamoyladenosine modification protein TsaB
VYQYNNGVLQRIGAGRLSTIAEVIKACKGACFCLGDGLGIYQREISGAGMRTLDKDYWYPTGRAIISAALANLKKKNTTDAFRLRPEYLYPKECQIKQA